jgi:hypothetical protein
MATWREHFEDARIYSGYDEPEQRDNSQVIAVAPDEAALDIEFDDSYGTSCGPHVLIWTEHRVYFPVVYDGAESLGSAPRYPQPEGQGHVGGE